MTKIEETKSFSSFEEPTRFIGIVRNLHHVKSKHAEDMCFMMLETNSVKIETVVFPSVYKKYSFVLENGKLVKITGHLFQDSSFCDKKLLPSKIEEII